MDDECAIQRLMTRYCHIVDDGAFDELPQLWVEDAELVPRGETDAVEILCGHVPRMVGVCPSPERRIGMRSAAQQ